MGYVILRTAKLTTMANIAGSAKHNFRERETPNAVSERTPLNTTVGAQSTAEVLAKVKDRLATVKTVRKNAVLAIEYMLSASPEFFKEKSKDEYEKYFDDAEKWIRDRHGSENVISFTRHNDETSPHACVYVVPIDQRGKLNAANWLDGREKMSAMQTEFAATVGAPHGLERGLEGSKAEHITIKQYYKRVNQAFEALPEVKTPVPKPLRDAPEKPSFFAGREKKEAYQEDYAAWQREKTAHDAQAAKRKAERKAETEAALTVARRHEAQAAEAQALKQENAHLKEKNSKVATKFNAVVKTVTELSATVALFRPTEIEQAQARRQKEEAALAARQAAAKAEADKQAQEKARLAVIAEHKRVFDALEAQAKPKEVAKVQSIRKESKYETPGLG